MTYTHTIKRPIQSLKKGTKITTFYHELLKEEVIGIPRSQNDFWTPEFVAKHPEIFQPNN